MSLIVCRSKSLAMTGALVEAPRAAPRAWLRLCRVEADLTQFPHKQEQTGTSTRGACKRRACIELFRLGF